MAHQETAHEADVMNQEARELWERNAEWWDDKVGEGNEFQRVLIGPATERLLGLRAGELVLDIACGDVHFSRSMAQSGARVIAFDFSEKFLGRARERTKENADRIEYRLVDATEPEQLMTLGSRRFDAAVCTMALMDMSTIEPLVSSLAQLLKAGGRFVFSVLHPCFNSTGNRMAVEEEDRGGELVTTYSVKVVEYIRPTAKKGVGIVGQPAPHYYFHRPISLLFNTCFGAGFVLDGIEEPVFEQPTPAERPMAWSNFHQIPPVLVARMRLLSYKG